MTEALLEAGTVLVCLGVCHKKPRVGAHTMRSSLAVPEAGDPGSQDLFPRPPLSRPHTVTRGVGLNGGVWRWGPANMLSTAGTSTSKLCSCAQEGDGLWGGVGRWTGALRAGLRLCPPVSHSR